MKNLEASSPRIAKRKSSGVNQIEAICRQLYLTARRHLFLYPTVAVDSNPLIANIFYAAITMAEASPPRERRLLGTSLKMYFSPYQTTAYTQTFLSLAQTLDPELSNLDLFLIPDFLSVAAARTLITSATSEPTSSSTLHPPLDSSTPLHVGAQDCSPYASGAYTGDVSPASLAELGVTFIELNHAERRRYHGETDETAAAKAVAAVKNGLVPLFCIGEVSPPSGPVSAAVGKAVDEVSRQIKVLLDAVGEDADVVFAYEPVWAIGAKESAGADHVVAVTKAIRGLWQGRRGRVRVLYGGSAGPGTFTQLKDGVDGLFLGRFAHDVKNLEKVIQEVCEL